MTSSITPPQQEILLLLSDIGPMRISAIARRLKMVDSNVSNICSRLVKSGLVERRRDDKDQRVVMVTLTDSSFEQIIE